MQLALAAGSTDRGTAPDVSPTTRANRLLAAGVALAGAGVIAVNPVAPLIPMAGHQPAVQLANTTAENLDYLQDLLSGPNPITTALGELGTYYGDVTQGSIDGFQEGLETLWSGGGRVIGLETLIPQITEFLQQGDTLSAWDLINNDILYNMAGIFQPLFDHTVRGTGEFVPGMMGIPADMTHVWANVQELFGDFSFWKSTFKYLFEPITGFQFALTENLSPVEGHEAQDPFDALLNGYITWDSDTGEETGRWWGLLTEQGTLSYFIDVLPSRIAEALTSTIPVEDVVDPDPAMATDSLLDLGWLDGLFS